MTPGRKLLGRTATLVARDVIYETEDGIESESTDQMHVTQRRVLFEDAQLITIHRELGVAYVVVMSFAALVFLASGAAILNAGSFPAALPFLIIGGVFAALVLARAATRVSVVTICGRRSKVAIRYPARHARARETYDHLRASISTAQAHIAAQYALQNDTPPAPPLPMPAEEPAWPSPQ